MSQLGRYSGAYMRPTPQNNNAQNGGLGFLGALFLVLLVLKLTHVIDWSWWWITAPLWGVLALMVAVGFAWVIVYLVYTGLRAVYHLTPHYKKKLRAKEERKKAIAARIEDIQRRKFGDYR